MCVHWAVNNDRRKGVRHTQGRGGKRTWLWEFSLLFIVLFAVLALGHVTESSEGKKKVLGVVCLWLYTLTFRIFSQQVFVLQEKELSDLGRTGLPGWMHIHTYWRPTLSQELGTGRSGDRRSSANITKLSSFTCGHNSWHFLLVFTHFIFIWSRYYYHPISKSKKLRHRKGK